MLFLRNAKNVCNLVLCRKLSQLAEPSSLITTDFLKGPDSGIVIVGLNNSKNKNALSKDFSAKMREILTNISNNSSSRVIVIRSVVPKVFCAGADLKERSRMSDSEVKEFVTSLRSLATHIENVPIPTIAAINGAALGGGLELALSCDIRVATDTSRIGLVETRLAILPGAGGTQRLPRLIGPSLAKELIFTARVLNGKEAQKLGIVNHCVPSDNESDPAFNKSLEIAREILPNGPIAVKMAKIAIGRGLEVDIDQGCVIEGLCYAQVIPTKDRTEGLKAFIEKRKPIYTGE